MSDSALFLDAYRQALGQEVARTFPASWLAIYDFEACLKSSGGKDVYLAVDKRNATQLILRATDASAPDRADVEWELLRRLDAPGIPKALGSHIENGRSFMAREYFPGTPLDEVVAQRRPSVAEAVGIARQLAHILRYLHGQNPPVIHRDIKPQNIILRPDGSIGLTDFGIARTQKPNATSDTTYAGTIPYAPPEQYGYAQSTPQTDIYAVGVVLIYLLTGSPERDNLAQRIPDANLRAIIEKCIAFDPANRYRSADELARQLDKIGSKKKGKVVAGVGAGVIAVTVCGVVLANVTGVFGTSTPIVASTPSARAGAPASAVPAPSSASPAGTSSPSPLAGWPVVPAPPKVGAYLGGGNYPGNISNDGLAVAGGDQLYVAVKAGILVLNPDGSYVRTLAAPGAKSLNYYDGMLYYRSGDDVRRMDPASGKSTKLLSNPGENIYIDSERLYYDDALDGLTLHSATLDGKDRRKVDDVHPAYYRQLSAGWQVYSKGDNNELTLANLSTGKTYSLNHSQATWSTIWNGSLYYTTEAHGLNRIDLATGIDTPILNQDMQFMVATDAGLFGLSSTTQELNLITPDGTVNPIVTASTGFFSVAGDWVFYQQDAIGGPLRMVKTDGTGDRELPAG